jgi:hypothetical protein
VGTYVGINVGINVGLNVGLNVGIYVGICVVVLNVGFGSLGLSGVPTVGDVRFEDVGCDVGRAVVGVVFVTNTSKMMPSSM